LPDEAKRAIQHYFLPGNLTALRELALRRTAQRVDAQMVDYMRAHRIEGPWPAGERVLVLVDAKPGANAVARHAKRLADRLRAQWTAIHVETPADVRASETERNLVAQSLRLAQRLGAEAISIPGQDVAGTVVEYAQANNFTHIIVATPEQPRWRDFFGESVTQKLIRGAGGASVLIARATDRSGSAPSGAEIKEARPSATASKPMRSAFPMSRPRPWLLLCCGRHSAFRTSRKFS